jgi:hypothetical protein
MSSLLKIADGRELPQQIVELATELADIKNCLEIYTDTKGLYCFHRV